MNEKIRLELFVQIEKVIEAAQKSKVYPKIYKGENVDVQITAIYRDLKKREELIKMIAIVDGKEFKAPNIKIIRSNNAKNRK